MFCPHFDVSIDNVFSGNLSVFFPAFNEEENIRSTTLKAVKLLKTLNLEKWEVIIVDDGSKDGTLKIAEELAKEEMDVRVIHQENGGYGKALRAGFYGAKYEWIVFTDSDGQFDFSEINKFLDKTGEADYVIGYRTPRADPFYRLVSAKIWAVSVFLLFGIWVKDIDCGFRMINKRVLDKIPKLESTRGAMINAELLIDVKRAGFKIVQVGVHHFPREKGQPTGVKLNVILKSYVELFKLRFQKV